MKTLILLATLLATSVAQAGHIWVPERHVVIHNGPQGHSRVVQRGWRCAKCGKSTLTPPKDAKPAPKPVPVQTDPAPQPLPAPGA